MIERDRFLREARLAATLSHPNLCPVYDCGEVDGVLYLTMAYLEGRPLAKFIRPEQPPYKNRVGLLIDSGHFQESMEKALEQADWAGFETRRAAARQHGKLRGIGLGYYCEASGGQPTEQAIVKVAPNGRVELIMGTFSHGQGHETAFSQIVAQKLGLPFEMIDFRQGDTEFVKMGNGTGGSRSSQMGGVATARVCDQVVEKAKRLVESGKDVVILLDSLTRFGRAHNTVAPQSGKILSGGVDASADQRPPDDCGDRNGVRETMNGCSMSKEHMATDATRTARAQVDCDRLTDISRQW